LSINRRELLRTGFYTGAGLLAGKIGFSQAARAHAISGGVSRAQASQSNHRTLARYVDPLPIPPVIRAPRREGEVVHISMRQFTHKAHRDLPPTPVWGYNGSWPGPTLEVRKGQALSVKWANHLPQKHFLPIDNTIHGAEDSLPEVRTVVHVHGAQAPPESDGYPEAWFTSDGRTGPAYDPRHSLYPNAQPAAGLWYHDHALGITRLNVYAGLAGFYLIRDEAEESLNLPSGPFEIPLMIQDRSFNPDGSLLYPAAQNGTHPIWIQEFFGETICVNGKAMPFLEVEARKYRFRVLNASNSRFYHLTLVQTDAAGEPAGRPVDAPPFHQIGTDSGLLPAPLQLHYLILSPGERLDLVIDFSASSGDSFALMNDAPAPYARGGQVVPRDVMLFRVSKPLSAKDSSSLPDSLIPFEPLDRTQIVRERVLDLTETSRASDGYTVIGLLGRKHWSDPITEDPAAGSVEVWSFANTTEDVHPIHTHLVRFQVLGRQRFDKATYLQSGKLVLFGSPIPPETYERPAWKDTVKAYPGYLTRVIQRFDLPPGTSAAPGRELRYVWHCHALEHEDNEMMRPYKVIAP
jgi:spore coat protein A, manganese oxidase